MPYLLTSSPLCLLYRNVHVAATKVHCGCWMRHPHCHKLTFHFVCMHVRTLNWIRYRGFCVKVRCIKKADGTYDVRLINDWHFAADSAVHEDLRIFMIISLSNLLLIRNVWNELSRKRTHFKFNNFINIVTFLYEVEKSCRALQATDDNRAHAYCMLDIYGNRHTLRICGTYCFSTAPMATR